MHLKRLLTPNKSETDTIAAEFRAKLKDVRAQIQNADFGGRHESGASVDSVFSPASFTQRYKHAETNGTGVGPDDCGTWFRVCEGWYGTPLFPQFVEGADFNNYIGHAEEGTICPLHRHVQKEVMFVMSGVIEHIETGTVVLPFEYLYFEPNEPHSLKAIKESMLIFGFRPPLPLEEAGS